MGNLFKGKALAIGTGVLLGLGGLPPMAQAQVQQWQVSQTDPSRPAVAIVPGTGNIAGMGLICDRSQIFLLMNLNQALRKRQLAGMLSIDGRSYALGLNLIGAPAKLSAIVTDPGLIDALASGSSVGISIDGQAIGTLPLAGSGAALQQALAGCWQPSPDAVEPVSQEMPRPVVPATERTAIMKAAGFTRRGDAWTTCDGEETGDIEQLRDVNGDGNPEALVTSYGTACHGFVGSGFTFLTKKAGAWGVLIQNSGIPTLIARQGMTWPDLEIGGPGSDCFPFLRWDGRSYVPGGTSLGDKICTLQPAFAAGAPLLDSGASGTPEGILGQVPVRLGYYVRRDERCAAPKYLYKFERARHLEISAFNGRIETVHYDYARVSGPEDGFYFITLKNSGPEDPAEIGIRPFRGGMIDLLIQDTVELTHCADNEVPAKLRR